MLASSYATRFALGFSLLIAIGAQNAFVLRQGLLRQHVFAVVLFCAVADMALIVVGVGGLSLLIADVAARYEAALFGLAAMWLAGYGVMRLRSAIRANAAIKAGAAGSDSLAAVLTTGAVLTFGNPHVHLDTVVLLGAVLVRFTGMDKLAYGTGAATASFVFFFALGYGASLLAPQMRRSNAWRVLDMIIAAVMFALAIGMARAGGWLGA